MKELKLAFFCFCEQGLIGYLFSLGHSFSASNMFFRQSMLWLTYILIQSTSCIGSHSTNVTAVSA